MRETIAELRRAGLMRNPADVAYADATAMLRAFYKGGETDKAVASAIAKIETDPYFKIIPLTFVYDYTLEDIAETFGVEISTITRNKKRLCVKVAELIE